MKQRHVQVEEERAKAEEETRMLKEEIGKIEDKTAEKF